MGQTHSTQNMAKTTPSRPKPTTTGTGTPKPPRAPKKTKSKGRLANTTTPPPRMGPLAPAADTPAAPRKKRRARKVKPYNHKPSMRGRSRGTGPAAGVSTPRKSYKHVPLPTIPAGDLGKRRVLRNVTNKGRFYELGMGGK